LIPIGTGTLNPDTPFHAAFTLKATCDVDTAPVTLTVNPARTGPAFIGIGGNFRLQSPADAAVIAYNLENLRVAWARLEMPLSTWQPTEANDPTTAPLPDKVRQAMEMGRTLAQKKIPMIISDWSVPSWAAAPAANNGQPGGGGRGQIAPEKWPAMYKGITSYIAYMKKNFGAEPLLFSFNEADMGINVKLTPEDQRTIIKGLGVSFAAAGLATKMLLGDTGNPTPRPANYIEPTIADPEAMKYVGAVSYHCWTGGPDQIIANWGQVAQKFKLPLYIAEGGTDPASYRTRNVFLEPWYALDEVNLYIRCMALSQPTSILHWQLTDDYSILSGGRNGQPLQPTQRFFNLKQMNLTPPEAPSLGITSDRPRITAAAYGDAAHGYAIHLVNTGTTRTVTLTGLPATLTQLYPTITDGTRGMKTLEPVPVSGGAAKFTLEGQSYTTLTSAKP
jgi:O-glycosyl hydrolase